MSTNNKVFQVLVTKGNAAPLAKNLTLDSLQPGQIGVFNASTNLSIDATSPAVKNFYIADKNVFLLSRVNVGRAYLGGERKKCVRLFCYWCLTRWLSASNVCPL